MVLISLYNAGELMQCLVFRYPVAVIGVCMRSTAILSSSLSGTDMPLHAARLLAVRLMLSLTCVEPVQLPQLGVAFA